MWIFLSHILSSSSPAYGGDESMKVEMVRQISKGDSSNSSRWSFPNHIGTHVDAPYHFSRNGQTVDRYDPEDWHFTSPQLVECPAGPSEWISKEKLGPLLANKETTDCLLIRTGFESRREDEVYWRENPGFDPATARWLRTTFPRLKVIGVDVISVSPWQDRIKGREAHRHFLGEDYPTTPLRLIEDMKLSPITAKLHEVWVLPLRVSGSDGAPCTVVARIDDA